MTTTKPYSWKPPKLVAASDEPVRKDQNNLIKANEYLDDEETLQSKVRAVADLVRQSRRCLCYTGAGISRSSGIRDYASRALHSVAAGDSSASIRNPMDAQPTVAHHALSAMFHHGLVKQFINQNHDGLFEKAGVPPRCSNLIHGDWYDVSNPVVQFSGNLRGDLFDRLLEWEQTADLCLVAGTSLSGMNADRVAHTCAKKRANKGVGFGVVQVNLQETPFDDQATVRVWATTDDFFPRLARELAIPEEEFLSPTSERLPKAFKENLFTVPYTKEGVLIKDKRKNRERLVLDLSPGKEVVIVQPQASNLGVKMTLSQSRDKEGNWLFELRRPGKLAIQRRFGRWYVHAAIKGELEHLPFVNVDPKVVEVDAASAKQEEEEKDEELIAASSRLSCKSQ